MSIIISFRCRGKLRQAYRTGNKGRH